MCPPKKCIQNNLLNLGSENASAYMWFIYIYIYIRTCHTANCVHLKKLIPHVCMQAIFHNFFGLLHQRHNIMLKIMSASKKLPYIQYISTLVWVMCCKNFTHVCLKTYIHMGDFHTCLGSANPVQAVCFRIAQYAANN